jgi:hypothetical protein
MADTPHSRSAPAAIGDVLSDPEHALGALCRHARKLARLDALLAAITDPETAAQFQVANLRQDRLILLTPTAAWATRLRMQAPRMIELLQASGYGQLRHIDIRVAPLNRQAAEPKSRRSLSPAARQAIEQLQRLSRR